MVDEPQSEPDPEPTQVAELIEPDEAQAEDPPQSATPPTPPTPAESIAAPVDTGYSASGVPTFDFVREKIETRYGASIGAAELDAETPEGRTIEEQYDARNKAAAERLAQIRESMGDESPKSSQ